MLTVLYRDEFGSDTIHEAQMVHRISPFDTDPRGRGVAVKTRDGAELFIPESSSKDPGPGRSVYVMNEHGATVATYAV